MELIDCGDIDFTKCGACMCENCSNCNKWKENQKKVKEITKNIKREDCFWDSRKDAKQKELEINELKEKLKKNQDDFLRLKIVFSMVVQQLNSKGLGIKI